MKKFTALLLLSVICYFIADAQNPTFTFNPSDAGNQIDSIKALVLSTGENYVSRGSNEISLGVTSVKILSASENSTVYPNPSYGQTQLQFYSSNNDDVTVTLINAAGQILASTQKKIVQGYHTFKITSSQKGFCMISAKGKNNRFSQKVMISATTANNSIEYLGMSLQEQKEKSALTDASQVIHFFVYSGDMITKIADTPTDSKTYDVEFYACKDASGKNYPIVQIGEHWWMAENLSFDSGAGCWVYNNDESNVSTYGRLYSLDAAKAVCPVGWHLPSDDEWKQLEIFLGMESSVADTPGLRGSNEGTRLKTVNKWINGLANKEGTDDFGFSAVPSGFYLGYGIFDRIGLQGSWWSTTEFDSETVWLREMFSDVTGVNRVNGPKILGFSARYIKD